MKSLWSDEEASQFNYPLGLRVYSSRLLGRDKTLVMHGGGNTSVKVVEKNIFGEDEEILYVKGSGWDLEKIEAAGFSPVRLAHVKRLAGLPHLSDSSMVNELTTHLTRAAPTPSVEAILHGILPFRYVDHTHADAVLTLTNTVDGEARIREIYGDLVVVIPYVMPGFDLARSCAELFPKRSGPRTIGMVLLNHGIFSFGDSAKVTYERMIRLVGMAEDHLRMCSAWDLPSVPATPSRIPATELAALRRKISEAMRAPAILSRWADQRALAFARRADMAEISQQGPPTPDHVIRTKRVPMLGRGVAAYAQAYAEYFAELEPRARERKTMLDTAPRVILDAELGLCTVGKTPKDAQVNADIYRHTMDIIERATILGGYRALSAKDIFDVEYWDLEQAKLHKSGKAPTFTGEIVLVTGAASGIGKACVNSFLRRGAAVIGADIDPQVVELESDPAYLGVECDLASDQAIEDLLQRGTERFGGLDMLVLNAGIFAATKQIEALGADEWRRIMQINLDANLSLMREAHPLLKLAPRGGRVVVVGSKNVPAPGPGAAAYSASKAALTQLARVAALEWGRDNIRVNVIHPNAVFDTALWTDEVLAVRAAHYQMSVKDYKKNNVLRTEVRSVDVAELAAEMCGDLFAKTTAAQVPVDGGNERVI